tara:strand:- start:44 stop:424 length:381 start_codon:yes stop_codon:yes gene_type:complete
MKSIDDATPEEWNNLNIKDTEDWDEPNDHPIYGENIPDNRLGKSYSNLINTMVDHPPHYNNGHIECIEAIEAMLTPDEFIGYLRGNSLKYRWRFRYKKKPIEDLRKARWYEEKLMDFLMENQDVLG